MRDEDDLKVYGAGIISSKGEMLHALSPNSRKKNFNVKEIIQHNFRTGVIQEEYYVIESFRQLKNSIGEIEREIEEALMKPFS